MRKPSLHSTLEEKKRIFNQVIRIFMMKIVDVFAEVGREGWLVVLSLFQGLLIQFIQFIDHGNCV